MKISMTRYRVAIIGTGAIANLHIQALEELKERVEVVAAVDVLPERVEAFSRQHAIPRFYTKENTRTSFRSPHHQTRIMT